MFPIDEAAIEIQPGRGDLIGDKRRSEQIDRRPEFAIASHLVGQVFESECPHQAASTGRSTSASFRASPRSTMSTSFSALTPPPSRKVRNVFGSTPAAFAMSS